MRSCYLLAVAALLTTAPVRLSAQQEAFEPTAQPYPNVPASAATRTTLHGFVRNGATGEPLARALVEVEGDADSGALTDGQGRFEIQGVPTGPQILIVRKPGFLDRPSAGPDGQLDYAPNPVHSVQVAPEMPDLVFALQPASAIYGHIVLSTGDPAEGIGVRLVQRIVQNGRAIWRTISAAKTNSTGSYRFAGLCGCTFAVYTEPAMDSQPASTLIAPGSKVDHMGYPSVFYLEARDLADAAKIRLIEGEQMPANFILTLEPFYVVTARVSGNSLGKAGQNANLRVTVLDGAGDPLLYSAQWDVETSTIQAVLPDGSYALHVSAFNHETGGNPNLDAGTMQRTMVGSVDFAVAGHAITDLRIPLSASVPGSVQLTLVHPGEQDEKPTESRNGQGYAELLAEQTGDGVTDGMTSQLARELRPGSNPANYLPPGAYWLRTIFVGNRWCEQSFTAGGANMTREPLIMSLAGGTAPLELTLRDDCAKLTLSLPPSVTAASSGEERFYTVYLVPDFETTVDLPPWTLRPSTGGSFTYEGLTPGSYRVLAFDTQVRLEYRNPAVLAALPQPGQAVNLSPGSSGNLVLEVEAR